MTGRRYRLPAGAPLPKPAAVVLESTVFAVLYIPLVFWLVGLA